MDIDLGEGWEKKALIIVAVVVFILVAYAYNPFQTKPNVTAVNETYKPASPAPASAPPLVSNDSNSSTNRSENNTFLISADQAKKIALDDYPGYTASEPIQGTIVLNQTTVVVWIVPISKTSKPSKTIYVDVNTGKIVKET
ncbi:MAG TPA: PepSY domain-containing protein [Methanobacterium sp.]|jgi:hypothetical protein|nr:PepSY domain-containing protein [Methanobacterium sp.]HOI40617.1 PepSY domain-containing protein [Methanobacterium sp.]